MSLLLCNISSVSSVYYILILIATQLLTDEQSKSIYSDFKNIEIGYMKLKNIFIVIFFSNINCFSQHRSILVFVMEILQINILHELIYFKFKIRKLLRALFQLENIGQLQNNKAVFYSCLLDTNKILILDINFACNIVFPQLKLKTNQTKTDWMPLWGFWFYRVYLTNLLYS